MGVEERFCAVLANTLSSDINEVKAAELELRRAFRQQQVATFQSLCNIVEQPGFDDYVRLQSALFIKNTVKKFWDDGTEADQIGPEAKQVLKTHMLKMVFIANKGIREQLFDLLRIVVDSDFPTEWPDLLNDLLTNYWTPACNSIALPPPGTGGLNTVNTPLNATAIEALAVAARTMRHIMESRFEFAESSNDTLIALQHALSHAEQPLLSTLEVSSIAFTGGLSASHQVCESELQRAEMGRLFAQIAADCLLSIKVLHRVDLPAFFEDNLDKLMAATFAVLRGALVSNARPEDLAASDETKTVACQLLYEYLSLYLDDFHTYVVEAINTLLLTMQVCTRESRQDAMASEVMKCIGTVAKSKSLPEAQDPFKVVPSLVKIIVEQIILPNVTLRDEDVDASVEDPLGYARMDLEGLERGARREAVTSLIGALLSTHEEETLGILSVSITNMLATAAAADGRSVNDRCLIKEAATFLMTAMSAKASVRQRGVTEVYALQPVLNYLESELLPVFAADAANSDASILVKCAALKFLAAFRCHIPRQSLQTIAPMIVKDFGSRSELLATNAAYCFEKLLTLRVDKTPYIDVQSNVEIGRHALAAVFTLLGNEQSWENEYIARCLWRLVAIIRDEPVAQMERLKQLLILLEGISGGSGKGSPAFCHYLFESIAVLSKLVALSMRQSGTPEQIREVHEFVVMRMAKLIQSSEDHHFTPYCFQVISGLVDSLPAKPGEKETGETAWTSLYKQVFDFALGKDRWVVSAANIPGLMTLLCSFMRRAWAFQDLLATNLPGILNRFQFSLGLKRVPTSITIGHFLMHIIAYYPLAVLQPMIAPLTKVLAEYLAPKAAALLSQQATQSRATRATPGHVPEPVVLTITALAALTVKCNMNGGVLAVGPSSVFDLPTALEEIRQGYFLDTFLPTFIRTTSVTSCEKSLLLGAVLVLLSHPHIAARPDTFKALLDTIPELAGIIRKQDAELERPAQSEAEDPERARQALLQAMTEDDEFNATGSGLDILSKCSSYNRLATGGSAAEEQAAVRMLVTPVLISRSLQSLRSTQRLVEEAAMQPTNTLLRATFERLQVSQ